MPVAFLFERRWFISHFISNISYRKLKKKEGCKLEKQNISIIISKNSTKNDTFISLIISSIQVQLFPFCSAR